MEVCPQHGCRLHSIEGLDTAKTRYSFAPLDAALPEFVDAEMQDIPSWHIQFSKILYSYATLPLSCAATSTHMDKNKERASMLSWLLKEYYDQSAA